MYKSTYLRHWHMIETLELIKTHTILARRLKDTTTKEDVKERRELRLHNKFLKYNLKTGKFGSFSWQNPASCY